MRRRNCLLLMGCWLTTAVVMPTHALGGEKLTSDPLRWSELHELDSFYASRTQTKAPQERGPRRWVGGFGWFVYRTLIDPGFMAPRGIRPPEIRVSSEVHEAFRKVAQGCTDYPGFAEALMKLFRHPEYAAWLRDDLNGWRGSPAPFASLTEADKRELRQVAVLAQDCVRDTRVPVPVRASAYLIHALTERTNGRVDSVSTTGLSQIGVRFRQEKFTVLAGQYYLWLAYERRQRHGKAHRLVAEVIAIHRDDPTVRDLQAYDTLRRWQAYQMRANEAKRAPRDSRHRPAKHGRALHLDRAIR